MKKVAKILVIGMIFIVLESNCYATAEIEDTAKNETIEQPIQNTSTTHETKSQVPEKPTETKKNETMYVQERCNIRSSYSVESDRVGGLDVGTEVTVIAEYSNGWYKIKYDGGKEAYIKAGILRSTKPVIPEPEPEETTLQEEPIQQTQNEVPENQVAEEPVTTNIQNDDLAKEIGVLPEVGKNIADYLYMSVIFMAIITMLVFRKYKFK